MSENPPEQGATPADHEPGKRADPSPWQQLRATLRGRYHWALVIPLLWGAVAGVAVYRTTEPLYQSEGAVRVKAYVQPLMYKDTGETGIMPMASSFADAQSRLLVSERVLEAALEDPAWERVDLRHVPPTASGLRRMLTVHDPGKQTLVIRVLATHGDPFVARTATRSVIDAYMDQRDFGQGESDVTRQRVLEQRKRDLTVRLSDLQEQVYELAREYGSDDLDKAYDHALDQLNAREDAINEAQLELAGLTSIAATEDAPPDERMTTEEIAVIDSHMRELIHQKRAMQRQLEGLAAEHPDRSDVEASLARQQEIIDNYAQAYLATRTSPAETRGADAARVKALEERLERLKKLYAEARTETLRLGRKKLDIDKLKGEIQVVGARLEETRRRLEQLEVESKAGERVEVVARGNTPDGPSNTQKRQQLAVLACFGAVLTGFGIVLLSAHVDPRIMDSEDLLDGGADVRILGMLPVLPDRPVNDERAARATYAIHHMRSLLQILVRRQPDRSVFAVTSPAAQSGKTSLVLSLGLSFAASGTRTLLIDTDLAGGGLTRRLRAIIPRLVGRILERKGLVTSEEVAEALTISRQEDKRIGEVLVAQGYISEADLTDALDLQKKRASRVGFIDVLEGQSPSDCLAESGIPNLSVLPVGDGVASDMTRVGPGNIRRLIEEVRHEYDQILVDTGPMGGDIASQLIAAEVDGVILCVSRGEQRRMARRALKQIRSIDAHLVGVVFNRANTGDLQRSIHSVDPSGSLSGVGKRSRREDAERLFIDEKLLTDSPVADKVENFGPVAHAVARSSVSLHRPNGRHRDEGKGRTPEKTVGAGRV